MPDIDDSPAARHQGWRQRRLAELDAPEGWPGLIGLHWLEPGANAVGTAPDSVVPLPEGPARLGVLEWQGEAITWRPAGGTAQPLQSDARGVPTPVAWGPFKFFVIEREGRLAVRLRDVAWQEKRPFAGLDCLPYDPAWRIEADWQALAAPVTMEVPTVTGELKTVTVHHRAVFQHQGQSVALLPMEAGEEGAFFVFRDATSGRLTYGAGRFLRCPPPKDGKVLLDFNRAYNPPCAFTPFATCPLPPPENWLGLAVNAGELKYRGDH
ncbi:MAG TPA: DUF1684 domain-containing protein [Azospira sp.]|nr:DUF1684 domain-containing protein [Azospira sp.]